MIAESYVLSGVGVDAEALDALIRRAQRGDEAAFEQILERFEARALSIARQLGATAEDAEDIAQDAFIKLFRHIESYRGGRRFTAYFYRIVINAARDHIARRPPSAGLAAPPEPATEAPDAGGAETRERVHAALMQLTDREREVVILRELHGLTTWEVARALKLNPVTVRRHLMRARARLKEILGLEHPPTGSRS